MIALGPAPHGSGNIRRVQVAQPALGNEFMYAMPDRTIGRILSFHAKFTVGAVAFTVIPGLEVLTDIFPAWHVHYNAALPQTNYRWFNFGPPGFFNDAFSTEYNVFIPIPWPHFILPGWIIQTTRDAPHGNNRWSECVLILETWLCTLPVIP